MKKLYILFIFVVSFLSSKAQLNPVKNLTYQQSYNYGNYNCPSFNCFSLSWTKPDSSLTDTLIGYKIYRNDTLYLFTTSTGYGCSPYGSGCSFSSPNWYYKNQFWITVKAVYNKDSVTSIAKDSVQMWDVMIDVNDFSVRNIFMFFPNPFSTQTTLKTGENLERATLTVYNSFGQQVEQLKNISGNSITLQRNNLSTGIYFIQLKQDDKIFVTKKLIITNN